MPDRFDAAFGPREPKKHALPALVAPDTIDPDTLAAVVVCNLAAAFTPRLPFARFAFGKDWTIFINPPSDRFIRDIDPALGHQFFNLPQTKIKSKVNPDNSLDDIRMKTATMIYGDFHPQNLTAIAKTAT